MSGLMMLRHLGLHGKAALIENALLATLESGTRTADFGLQEIKASSTKEFAEAIISRLGNAPKHHAIQGADSEKSYTPTTRDGSLEKRHRVLESPRADGKIVGIDLFVEINQQPAAVAAIIESLLESPYRLTLISNRGTQVWPSGSPLTDCVNQYRVRIEAPHGSSPTDVEMLKVAVHLAAYMKVCPTELLMQYNGVAAYSLAQGQ
jgi:isocitrate dehydrogenase